jgi:hypothetical protein
MSVTAPLIWQINIAAAAAAARLNMVSMEEQLVHLNKFIENWPASARWASGC